MTEREVKQVVVVFSCTLSDKEVPLFRGAMLHAVQGESTLFHDHIGEGFRYRYPLIQYRSMDGYASAIGLEEGVEAIDRFLADGDVCKVRIGRRTEPLLVTRIKRLQTTFALTAETEQTYVIRHYLPFNQENYKAYQEMDSLIERYALIEKCLVGNILSLAKSLGVFFDQKVVAKLVAVDNEASYKYKNIKMVGFDLKFKTNVQLPQYIGLGKGVSLGFGEIRSV